MSLLGTLAKVAIGYAAARGVDKLSGGQGMGSLLGGGAQVKGHEPGTEQQAQMGAMMGAGNPMAEMMQKMQQGGLGAMLGGSGSSGGLLSALTGGSGAGAGLAGILAAAGGTAAAAGGKSASSMIDQFNTADTAPEAEAAAGLMLRAMIQAAKSDGGIDEAEKAKILETIGEDATAEDMAFVQAQLAAPVDAKALASDTPDAQKMQVYAASLMTIRLDTQAEAEYLDQLSKAMGLPETAVNQIHMQMGMQPLYN